MKWKYNNFYITDSKENMDIDFIINSLHTTYWAEGRPGELIIKAIENSVLLSLFDDETQIGFARIVSDGAVFAWICDVFITEKYRGKGLGKFLMQCVMDHPAVKVRTNVLGTRNAHGLYEKYGFEKKELMLKRNEYDNSLI
jgi:GNAT superfamily N-acetyltransferase